MDGAGTPFPRIVEKDESALGSVSVGKGEDILVHASVLAEHVIQREMFHAGKQIPPLQ